jgi:branched-chain amino acid transport system permease protein
MGGIITGVIIGGVLSLPVMGVALVYGVSGILNYAIATIGTFGVFVTWMLRPSLGTVPSIMAGLLSSFALGFGLQRFILNPVIRKKGIDLTLFFIITFGVATVVSGLTKILFPRPTISIELPKVGTLLMAGAAVDVSKVIGVIIAVAVLFGIWIVELTTKTGKAWVATSQNLKMAKLVGINVELVFSLVSGIGHALGFVGALFWAVLYNLTVNTGWDLCFLGYIIAIVGGIGNVWGGMISALIMGIVISLAGYWLGGMWQSVLLYGILLVILIIAPRGILGKER